MRESEEEGVSSYRMTLIKLEDMETEKGNTRPPSVDNSPLEEFMSYDILRNE